MNKRLHIFSAVMILFICLMFTGCDDILGIIGQVENTNFTYTIYYTSEYGTAPENKEVEAGYILTQEDLPSLTHNGYNFLGWSKKVGYKVESDVKITAKWRKKIEGSGDVITEENVITYGSYNGTPIKWELTCTDSNGLAFVQKGVGLKGNPDAETLCFNVQRQSDRAISIVETTLDVKQLSALSFIVLLNNTPSGCNLAVRDNGKYADFELTNPDTVYYEKIEEVNKKWRQVIIPLTPGTHNIRFEAEVLNSYWVKNPIYIDELGVETVEALTQDIIDFNNGKIPACIKPFGYSVKLDAYPFNEYCKVSPVQNKEEDTKDTCPLHVLPSKHKESLLLKDKKIASVADKSGFTFITNETQESYLTFDVTYESTKSSYYYLYVEIDNLYSEVLKVHDYYESDAWKKRSFKIPKGLHVVRVYTDSNDYRVGDIETDFYIDNIQLVNHEPKTIELETTGLQETYVNGEPLNFYAKFRDNNGVLDPEKKLTWRCTGGRINEYGVYTPGSVPGTYTVSVSADGITKMNNTVVVHPQNYLEHNFTIAGETFRGYEGTYKKYEIPEMDFWYYAPDTTDVTTDGFIQIYGKAGDRYNIEIQSDNDSDFFYYKPRSETGDFFNMKYFDLRQNPSTKTVLVVHDKKTCTSKQIILFNSYTDTHVYPDIEYPKQSGFQWSYEDFGGEHKELAIPYTFWTALRPESLQCNWDDFLISNVYNTAVDRAGPDADPIEVLYEFFRWENEHIEYVLISRTWDAHGTIVGKSGACTEKAYLFNAFARRAGYICDTVWGKALSHNWDYIYYNGSYYMVDPTWNYFINNYMKYDIESISKYEDFQD